MLDRGAGHLDAEHQAVDCRQGEIESKDHNPEEHSDFVLKGKHGESADKHKCYEHAEGGDQRGLDKDFRKDGGGESGNSNHAVRDSDAAENSFGVAFDQDGSARHEHGGSGFRRALLEDGFDARGANVAFAFSERFSPLNESVHVVVHERVAVDDIRIVDGILLISGVRQDALMEQNRTYDCLRAKHISKSRRAFALPPSTASIFNVPDSPSHRHAPVGQ